MERENVNMDFTVLHIIVIFYCSVFAKLIIRRSKGNKLGGNANTKTPSQVMWLRHLL